MKQSRLNLFTVNLKYIRNLSKADDHIFSISPQIGKNNRPFLGIIVICDNRQYCIPLSSPKTKHKSMNNDIDFTKKRCCNFKKLEEELSKFELH